MEGSSPDTHRERLVKMKQMGGGSTVGGGVRPRRDDEDWQNGFGSTRESSWWCWIGPAANGRNELATSTCRQPAPTCSRRGLEATVLHHGRRARDTRPRLLVVHRGAAALHGRRVHDGTLQARRRRPEGQGTMGRCEQPLCAAFPGRLWWHRLAPLWPCLVKKKGALEAEGRRCCAWRDASCG